MKLFTFFLLVSPSFLRSQSVRFPENGMIHLSAYSSKCTAFFGGNQAALASLKKFSAGIYGERKFSLGDFNHYYAGFYLPTNSGNLGFTAGYFGSGIYNETHLGLAYARTISQLSVGAQFNYYGFKIPGYVQTSAVNFEGGIILQMTDDLRMGVHIYNPERAKTGNNKDQRLPMIYSAGLGYDVSEIFFVGMLIEKTEDRNVNISAGFEYSFEKKLFVRAGISSAVPSFYFGTGFLWNAFRIELTLSVHPAVGNNTRFNDHL